MSFGFDDGDHVAWSVEVRREKTSEFSPIADAFKSHTLVYLATTERDLVRLRSNVRGEDVRLYRLNTPPQQARLLLLEYASQSTALAERPKFYNSITANCATVVFKLVMAAGSTLPLDWRLVVNGFLPGYLYDHGAVVTTMPLSELMERARISERARAADGSPDFSRLIRVGVPSPWDWRRSRVFQRVPRRDQPLPRLRWRAGQARTQANGGRGCIAQGRNSPFSDRGRLGDDQVTSRNGSSLGTPQARSVGAAKKPVICSSRPSVPKRP